MTILIFIKIQMIDLKKFKNNFDEYKKKILKKDQNFPVDEMMNLYIKTTEGKTKIDALLCECNIIAANNKSGNVTPEVREKVLKLQNEIETLKKNYEITEKKFNDIYLRCPNILDDSIQSGNKDQNKVVFTYGEKPKFNFKPKFHTELLEGKNLINFEIGAKIAKSGFVFYQNKIAKLIYKLINIFLKHNEKYGFNMILPPYVVSYDCLEGASNLPRFEEEVFKIGLDNLYLVPTAEVALNYIHAGESLLEENLPLRYTAWTPCFRREAGGYGSHERGLIRIHQFEKVEIFSFCHPEKSYEEQEHMIECAKSILNKFNLHYQICQLAAEDCSFASARTFDIEIWLPGQNQYREISSISNCTDFQSRRCKTKFKDKNQKSHLVHTLNGSCFAIPRLLVALFETHQTEFEGIDFGSIETLLSQIEATL